MAADRPGGRGDFELRFPSDPKYIAVARAVVEQAALAAGLDDKGTHRIVLGLGEAISNVIRHCYGGRCDRELLLRVKIEPDRLEIQLQDYGREVLPEELHERYRDISRPGGLGLHIMHEVMDEIDLTFINGTGNCLTMVKFLTGARESRPAGKKGTAS